MNKPLLVGDAAPWFRGEVHDGAPNLAFDPFGGRPVVLLMLGDANWPGSAAALEVLARHRELFDDARAAFFGVVINRSNTEEGLVATDRPGVRWYIDHDQQISTQYGAVGTNDSGATVYLPHWLLLDPMLRVLRTVSLERGEVVMTALRERLTANTYEVQHAPVLIVPRIFEPDMCRQLIDRYEREGGVDSGTMREENGLTVGGINHEYKKRSDCLITDQSTMDQLAGRLQRFLVPQIERAFQFTPTRIERFLVACYNDENGGGHFKAHRDNTTAGTAHRKFACTINLNAEDYEGGDLWFPEFSDALYRAPTGGAAIFSCALMHGVRRVTRGKRYAFLPFFYDDAGHDVRKANLHLLGDELLPLT